MSERTRAFEPEDVADDDTPGSDAASRFLGSVARKLASAGSAAANKAGHAGRRLAQTVARKAKDGASKGGRAAATKLASAGIELSRKQQALFERLHDRSSGSES